MSIQSMTLKVNLSSEDNKLLFFTLWFLTKEMVLIKVFSQIRILSVEILKSIRVTEMTEVMIFSQVFEQIFIINKSLIAKLA